MIASSQPQRGEMAGNAEIDEQRFVEVAQQTIGADELKAVEIFLIFTQYQRDTLGFKDFFLLILLYSAKDEGKLLHLLYKYGPFTYEHLGLSNKERIQELGKILDIDQEVLETTEINTKLTQYEMY